MAIIRSPFLFFLLVGLMFCSHVSSGQTRSSFQHLNSDKGLYCEDITCISQDAEGFIWIGTQEGLFKFDGYTCTPLETEKNACQTNAVTECLLLDRKGRLWVGTSCGVQVLNTQTGIFKSYFHEKGKPGSIGNSNVTSIVQDEYGSIWVGTRNGIYRFVETDQSFIPYRHDTVGNEKDVYYKNRVIDMVSDKKGSLWIATLKGLFQFSLKTHNFKDAYTLFKGSDEALRNNVQSLAFDKDGRLWVVPYENGIMVLDIKKVKTNHLSKTPDGLVSDKIRKIVFDGKGRLWVATKNDGLQVHDYRNSNWTSFKHDIFDEKTISANQLTTLFADKDGILWIGTSGKGLERISEIPDKFTSYIAQPGKPNGLYDQKITAACEDVAGNIWLGTNNGLVYHNRALQSFRYYRANENGLNSLSNHYIFAVAIDAEGKLWAGTQRGLNQYDPLLKKWTRYFSDSTDSITNNEIYCILSGSNGDLWLGTNHGPFHLKKGAKVFETRNNQSLLAKFRTDFYYSIFEDSKKHIWYSSSRGEIYQIDTNLNILQSTETNAQLRAFSPYPVNKFTEDAAGNVWMLCDAGVMVYHPRTGLVSKIQLRKKGVHTIFRSLEIASDHSVWVSKNDGIMRIGFKRNIGQEVGVDEFNHVDGLPGDIYNKSVSLKLKSGELLFGGLKGFATCNPKEFIFNKVIPDVYVTSFKVFDKELKPDGELFSRHEVKLSHSQNFFSFEMSALSYDRPEKNQYAYQLEGFDNEMIYCGTKREISYTNVPPGNYILHIIASNNDGVWNLNGSKMKLTVKPHFIQTTWFLILVFLIIMLMIYMVYKYRINHVKRNEKLKREITRQISEARMKALRAQMNPHFIFNTLNSIQQFITSSNKQEALRYLSKFAKLIRLVLQNAEKNINTLEDELIIIEFYLELESLRFENRFTWHFTNILDLEKNEIEIPAMILQPFVENAVIHGLLNKTGSGHLEITTRQKNNTLICIIEDNGIGRDAAMLIRNKKQIYHQSMGMKVTEERMAILQQITALRASHTIYDLKDDNGFASGTRVVIEIQFNRNND